MPGLRRVELRGPVRLVASRLDPAVESTPRSRAIVGTPSVVSPRSLTKPEGFYRFSAFPNDRRVHKNGSFRSGTYATTYHDAKAVPSGFAAVGRYALPNPLSARFMYTIVTARVPTYVGAVAPAFGQAGGGVEVLFRRKPIALSGQPHEVPTA